MKKDYEPPTWNDPRHVTWAEMYAYCEEMYGGGGGGGGGGSLQKASVTISHTQILSLASSYVTLILGIPNKTIVPWFSYWRSSSPFIAYSGTDTTGNCILALVYDDWSLDAGNFVDGANMLFKPNSSRAGIPFQNLDTANNLRSQLQPVSDVSGIEVRVALSNPTPLSGGDPTNTLTVTAWYTVED